MAEWDDEPDEWRQEMMVAIRNTDLKHWCGYVAVPRHHPFWGKHYDDPGVCSISVHGGLTYAGDCCPKSPPQDDLWWFGFDCGHWTDYSPGMESVRSALSRQGFNASPIGEETYRNLDYVKAEIMSLAKQLVRAYKHDPTED